jgi:hypothetical protein
MRRTPNESPIPFGSVQVPGRSSVPDASWKRNLDWRNSKPQQEQHMRLGESDLPSARQTFKEKLING